MGPTFRNTRNRRKPRPNPYTHRTKPRSCIASIDGLVMTRTPRAPTVRDPAIHGIKRLGARRTMAKSKYDHISAAMLQDGWFQVGAGSNPKECRRRRLDSNEDGLRGPVNGS